VGFEHAQSVAMPSNIEAECTRMRHTQRSSSTARNVCSRSKRDA
jgi:hypothetical protein